MTDERGRRVRYGEAFWRAHHEAWQRSDLNQREYCAAQGILPEAFGNWQTKSWRVKAHPKPWGLSHYDGDAAFNCAARTRGQSSPPSSPPQSSTASSPITTSRTSPTA